MSQQPNNKNIQKESKTDLPTHDLGGELIVRDCEGACCSTIVPMCNGECCVKPIQKQNQHN